MKPHPTLTHHYATEAERRTYLNRLFDAGAPFYDRIDRLGSLGTGRFYRRDAQRRTGLKPGMQVLDVAAGTGLMAEGARQLGVAGEDIVCLDPCAGMLAITRKKLGVETRLGTAEAIPLPAARFDFLTMGFALRHVADLEGAFREYHRVLRPGGRVLILEITKPEGRLTGPAFRFWFRHFYPAFARLITGSKDAGAMMRYYWETMDTVVPPATILDAIAAAGFTDVRRHVVGGIFSEYSGVKR